MVKKIQIIILPIHYHLIVLLLTTLEVIIILFLHHSEFFKLIQDCVNIMVVLERMPHMKKVIHLFQSSNIKYIKFTN